MIRKLTLAAAFGAGYVLGAKAGKGRYDQIVSRAQDIAGKPAVQSATDKVSARATDVAEQAKDKATALAGDAVETVKDKVKAVEEEVDRTEATTRGA